MPLDWKTLRGRKGELTAAEIHQLTLDMTAAKLLEMSRGIQDRTGDQPVKVIPRIGTPRGYASGYFTQQKYVWQKTPQEMEAILGIFTKLRDGAFILQFIQPLRSQDYENRAYSYLPNGKKYEPNRNEKVYLPAKEPAPQFELRNAVPAECIATLQPGQRFDERSIQRK
jgi:hypothetical protein